MSMKMQQQEYMSKIEQQRTLAGGGIADSRLPGDWCHIPAPWTAQATLTACCAANIQQISCLSPDICMKRNQRNIIRSSMSSIKNSKSREMISSKKWTPGSGGVDSELHA
ncbi:hypothetical protein AVEN_87287-1 [Araneus ventricosus]|uniref:Uncharacterized protein n=1 Tax=Araneus ventricosus TaxID=182803 RepID=A0A4Y2ECX2_ARAVE|nr:hypothetical protein AVEN_87287-1 [Araneus ventricosus]